MCLPRRPRLCDAHGVITLSHMQAPTVRLYTVRAWCRLASAHAARSEDSARACPRRATSCRLGPQSDSAASSVGTSRQRGLEAIALRGDCSPEGCWVTPRERALAVCHCARATPLARAKARTHLDMPPRPPLAQVRVATTCRLHHSTHICARKCRNSRNISEAPPSTVTPTKSPCWPLSPFRSALTAALTHSALESRFAVAAPG